MPDKKISKKKQNTIIIVVILLALLTALYFIAKKLGWLDIFSSVKELQDYVSSFGPWAPTIFFLLQVLQVILSPIPGNITTLAGGALFGLWPSFIISSVAVLTGSIIAFSLARAFGRPLVAKLAGEEVTAKYIDTLSSKHKVLLVFMFLLPFFPDDALCLIAGLTGISWPFFILVTALTRPLGLLFSSLVGSGVIDMPLWGWIVLITISVMLMALSYKYTPRIETWLKNRLVKRMSAHDNVNK